MEHCYLDGFYIYRQFRRNEYQVQVQVQGRFSETSFSCCIRIGAMDLFVSLEKKASLWRLENWGESLSLAIGTTTFHSVTGIIYMFFQKMSIAERRRNESWALFQKQIISSEAVRYCELCFLSLHNVISNSTWWFHWHEWFDSSAKNLQLIFLVDFDSKDFNLNHDPTQLITNNLSQQQNLPSHFQEFNASSGDWLNNNNKNCQSCFRPICETRCGPIPIWAMHFISHQQKPNQFKLLS